MFTRETFEAEGFAQPYAWLDLVNSEHYDGFGHLTEHLDDVTWVEVFGHHWDLDVEITNSSIVQRLRRLRTFFRRAAETIAGGKNLSKSDLGSINRSLRVSMYRRVRIRRNGSYVRELVPARRDWKWQKAELLESLATVLSEGLEQRLKTCANRGCRWVFLDQSPGNTRKWCDDLTCGNRDKVRRFRARLREGDGGRKR